MIQQVQLIQPLQEIQLELGQSLQYRKVPIATMLGGVVLDVLGSTVILRIGREFPIETMRGVVILHVLGSIVYYKLEIQYKMQ